MNDSTSFKVGDNIVKFGEVCRIIKIEKKKDVEGNTEEILYYKAYYAAGQQAGNAVCHIPAQNVSLASIRKPISKDDLLELLQVISTTVASEEPTDIAEYRETFNSNDPIEIARILKRIWIEKKEKDTELSKSKRDLFNSSMKILAEEVAVVENISLPEATKIITQALKA